MKKLQQALGIRNHLLLCFRDSLMSFMSESSKSNTNKTFLHVQ